MLTRGKLLKRASLGALALAFGKLPELGAGERVALGEMTGVPTLRTTRGAAWLPLDGRTLTRHEYPELHAALRDVYGSPSDVEFQVPDFRGRVMLGDRPPPAGPDAAEVMLMMRTGGPHVGDMHWRAEA